MDRIWRVLLAFVVGIATLPVGGWSSAASLRSAYLVHGDIDPARVLIIEDIHYSSACQRRIVEAFEEIRRRWEVKGIFLEGAGSGKLELSEFVFLKRLSPRKFRTVLERLLKAGKVSAGEFLGLCYAGEYEILGLEDVALYQKNLSQAKRSWALLSLLDDLADYSAVLEKVPHWREFLRVARRRSFAFVDSIQPWVSGSAGKWIVICGGFHSKDLARTLEEKGVSTAVLRPRIYSLVEEERREYLRRILDPWEVSLLAPPVCIDGRDLSPRGYGVWLSIARAVLPKGWFHSGDLRHYPVRLPLPLWDRLQKKVEKLDPDLYYIFRSTGLAWTDELGRIHYIDEVLSWVYPRDWQTRVGYIWVSLLEAVSDFYQISGDDLVTGLNLVKDVVRTHEGLHALLRMDPNKRKIFLKKVSTLLGKKAKSYLAWVEEVYGPMPGYRLYRGSERERWLLEELAVIALQEKLVRKKRDWAIALASALEREGVRLPEPQEGFVSAMEHIAREFLRQFPRAGSGKLERVEPGIVLKDPYKRLFEKAKARYNNKIFRRNVTESEFVKVLYLLVSRKYPKDSLLKKMALLSRLDAPHLEKLLEDPGLRIGEKEKGNLRELLRIYRALRAFSPDLDPTKPLPGEHYLRDAIDYAYQLVTSHKWGRKALILLFNRVVAEFYLFGYSLRESDPDLNRIVFIFLPLAERLGMWELYRELSDVMFALRNPVEFYRLKAEIKAKVLHGYTVEEVSNAMWERLYANLPELDEYPHSFRIKALSSIWMKISSGRKERVEEMADLLAGKIVVPDEKTLEKVGKQVEGIFDEGEELSKEVKRVEGRPYLVFQGRVKGVKVEVQVRTQALDELFEERSRAHWIYNLRKRLPPRWKDQKFEVIPVKKDPVILLVRYNRFRRSLSSEYRFVRLSYLKKNWSAVVGSENRLFCMVPGLGERSVAEYDLKYVEPSMILEDMRMHPDRIYLLSNRNEFREILEAWKDVRIPFLTGLLLALWFLFPHQIGLPLGVFALMGGIKVVSTLPKSVKVRFSGGHLLLTSLSAGRYEVRIRDEVSDGVKRVGELEIRLKDQGLEVVDKADLPLEAREELLRWILDRYGDNYRIDLMADETVLEFYWNRARAWHRYPCKDVGRLVFIPIHRKISIWVRRLLSELFDKLGKYDVTIRVRERLLSVRDREDVIQTLRTIFLALGKIQTQSREKGEEGLFVWADELRKEMELVLYKIEDVFLPIDLRAFVLKEVERLRKDYPEVEIEVRVDVKGKVYTYFAIKTALRHLLLRAVKEGRGRVAVSAWCSGGELLIRVQDYGKGIPTHIRPMVFEEPVLSSLDVVEAGGYGFIHLRDVLNLVGGRISMASLTEGEGVGAYSRERLDLQARIEATKQGTGTIFEVALPAFPERLSVEKPAYDTVLVTGPLGSGRRWLARRLQARYGLYYVPLDCLLLSFVDWMRRSHPELLQAMVDLSETPEKEVLYPQVVDRIKQYLSNLKFRKEGIIGTDGTNLSWFLNEVGLLDELWYSREEGEVVFRLIKGWGEFVESQTLIGIRDLKGMELRAKGFKGLVVRSWFPLRPDFPGVGRVSKYVDVSSASQRLAISTDHLGQLPWQRSGEEVEDDLILSTLSARYPNAVLRSLVFQDESLDSATIAEVLKRDYDWIPSVLDSSLPFSYKRRLLDLLLNVVRTKAKLVGEEPLVEEVMRRIRDLAFSVEDDALKAELMEFLRLINLYRIADTVRNKINPSVMVNVLQIERRLRKGELERSEELAQGLSGLKSAIRELDSVLRQAEGISLEEGPIVYGYLLRHLGELVGSMSEARFLPPAVLEEINETIASIRDAMYNVEWLGNPTVEGLAKPVSNFFWQPEKRVRFSVEMYLPGLGSSREEVEKHREELNRRVKVVLHLASVEKVGGSWEHEMNIPMELARLKEEGGRVQLVYEGDVDIGDLGPGVYEVNFSAISPTGRIWWDWAQRPASEENPYGNLVVRVRLNRENRETFLEEVKRRFFLWRTPRVITLDEFGKGYLLDYNVVRNGESEKVLVRLIQVNGFKEKRSAGSGLFILLKDGSLRWIPGDLKGVVKSISSGLMDKRFSSADELVETIVSLLKETYGD